MKKIDAFDFATYPVNGFKSDAMNRVRANGEHDVYRWYINDEGSKPMVALAYTEDLVHALYPEYGKIAWEFAKHYSRDQKTGVIKYNPNAK
jgi:glutathione peroxidase-family protein